MALHLSIETDTGYEISYHKISSTPAPSIDAKTLGGRIYLLSYKDQASRQADKKPVSQSAFVIPDGTMTAEFIDGRELISACYGYLKTLPNFEGAEDI